MGLYDRNGAMQGEAIYQELYRRIMSLELKPGQLISENGIAKEFHVSRSPIRGAFQQLANKNLLEIRPQRGTVVTLLDVGYIRETVYIREQVENNILQQVMETADEKLFDRLLENLKGQEQTMKEDGSVDTDGFNLLDMEFHRMCFEHLSRLRLWEILTESQIQYQRFRMLDILTSKMCKSLVDQHRQIYKFLRDKKPAQLSSVLEEHLFDSVYRLEDIMLEKYPEYFIS